MATIKSFTSLEQSRKLAEILPLESADMFYIAGKGEPIFIGNKMVACGEDDYDALGEPDVLCWSLVALLSVLPAECECMALEHINYGNNYKEYFMHYIGGENTENYDNPVDACYEMILKLNELKML